MTDIVTRLRNPPFGIETSERNLMTAAADKIDGLEDDLKSALACLWKRGDSTARLWCKANYPGWSARQFDPDATPKE